LFGRLLDDVRRVTFESVEQLVRKQPLIDPAEMMVGISANGCNDRVNNGRQPSQIGN
jgi:hypothetical protein